MNCSSVDGDKLVHLFKTCALQNRATIPTLAKGKLNVGISSGWPRSAFVQSWIGSGGG